MQRRLAWPLHKDDLRVPIYSFCTNNYGQLNSLVNFCIRYLDEFSDDSGGAKVISGLQSSREHGVTNSSKVIGCPLDVRQ